MLSLSVLPISSEFLIFCTKLLNLSVLLNSSDSYYIAVLNCLAYQSYSIPLNHGIGVLICWAHHFHSIPLNRGILELNCLAAVRIDGKNSLDSRAAGIVNWLHINRENLPSDSWLAAEPIILAQFLWIVALLVMDNFRFSSCWTNLRTKSEGNHFLPRRIFTLWTCAFRYSRN